MKQVFDSEGKAVKCEPVDAREMIASGSYYASYDLVPMVREAKQQAALEEAEALAKQSKPAANDDDAPKLTKKQQAAKDAADLLEAQDLTKG